VESGTAVLLYYVLLLLLLFGFNLCNKQVVLYVYFLQSSIHHYHFCLARYKPTKSILFYGYMHTKSHFVLAMQVRFQKISQDILTPIHRFRFCTSLQSHQCVPLHILGRREDVNSVHGCM
jgi:hypothetical protein